VALLLKLILPVLVIVTPCLAQAQDEEVYFCVSTKHVHVSLNEVTAYDENLKLVLSVDRGSKEVRITGSGLGYLPSRLEITDIYTPLNTSSEVIMAKEKYTHLVLDLEFEQFSFVENIRFGVAGIVGECSSFK